MPVRRCNQVIGFASKPSVMAITHRTGCGMASDGEPVRLLRRVLAGYATHPNFYGELLPEANRVRREPVPASRLVLALQCGGSDGDSGVSANPTPGNKRGGLTTILEKSLGAVVKGGTTGLMDVYEYAEPVAEHGFVFMDTPGYDPVSITGQVAGGANVVAFTTGRGAVT